MSLAEHEPKLKEILYNCLEQIRATKAALYVSEGEGPFNLVAQYGFRDNVRKQIAASDDLVDRLLIKRAPFVLNGLTADPRFSEILYQSDTTRMLVAPIYSRGKLYGFVDMRDKAGQQPFEGPDVEAATRIAEQFLEILIQKSVIASPTVPVSQQATRVQEETSEIGGPMAKRIEEARAIVARGGLRGASPARALTEKDVSAGAALLPAIVALPSALLASFSALSTIGGSQVVCAKSSVSDEALAMVQGKLRAWLQKRNEPDKVTQSITVTPFGTSTPRIEAGRLVSIMSAPLKVEGVSGLVLTVAFDAPPTPETRTQLETFLTEMQNGVRNAISNEDLRATRQKIAEKLLEPDFDKYPALVAHSTRVSDLAERLAQFVGLSPEETESIRLAALLHDLGMRVLNYDKLYRKQTPTSDDQRLFREHPLVGAAMIAESPLGKDIARMVLSHHERIDGTGYPNGVEADQIPIGSRIIHICESFDAMTAPDSYQSTVPPSSAVGKIRRSAGTQFDATLAEKFAEMIGRS